MEQGIDQETAQKGLGAESPKRALEQSIDQETAQRILRGSTPGHIGRRRQKFCFPVWRDMWKGRDFW